MKTKFGLLTLLAFGLTTTAAWSQSNSDQSTTTTTQTTVHTKKKGRSPGGDVGSGSADIGKGAGKAAGNLAAGAGKGAVDLVTLHPIDAAGALGKGAGSAGKNVAVGTTKGTGKIIKGSGQRHQAHLLSASPLSALRLLYLDLHFAARSLERHTFPPAHDCRRCTITQYVHARSTHIHQRVYTEDQCDSFLRELKGG